MPLAPLQIYLSQNVLMLFAYALLLCLRSVSSRLRCALSYRHQLHCAYWLLAASVLAPVVAALFGHHDFLPATAQIWSAPSLQAATAAASGSRGATVSLTSTGTQLRLDLLMWGASTICASGLAIALMLLLVGAGSTRRLIAGANLIRKRGALRILASPAASVPFSFWRPGRFFIVVPVSLLTRPEDLRIALRHEAQHHRQGDTWLLYGLGLVRGAFFLNPALHLLGTCVQELQEFACDEAVISRHPLTARRYCDCLLWVAENALAQRLPPICMPMVCMPVVKQKPPALDRPRTMLGRRIQTLLLAPKRRLHACIVVTLQLTAVAMLLAASVALAGTVQDRRISAAEALEMASIARRDTSFPIVVNAEVVAEINRLVGTPDGRAYMRESLRRMRAHQELVAQKLDRGGLPAELLAVPLVESGYRNRPEDGNPGHGAGIWMFIRPTAQAMGLAVDDSHDDRLSPALETDSAVRFLSGLMREFGDWNLALLAYNAGSAFVHGSIHEAGTRDAFELTQRGYEHDPHYLARVMATIIVMKPCISATHHRARTACVASW